jgi:hypothetical protein
MDTNLRTSQIHTSSGSVYEKEDICFLQRPPLQFSACSDCQIFNYKSESKLIIKT